MKTSAKFIVNTPLFSLYFLILAWGNTLYAANVFQQDQQVKEYKGIVVDSHTGEGIALVVLNLKNSSISTITNSSGEFSLKVPENLDEGFVNVSYLGYQPKDIPLSSFKSTDTRIELVQSMEELPEVSLLNGNNASDLLAKALQKRGDNYLGDRMVMTGFYRETIQKRRRNVSLSEAVVKILKQPNESGKKDQVSIYKARKSTDYEKLDTIALKLQGGPYNALYADIMKYPEFLFGEFLPDNYQFGFDNMTRINDEYVFVINFAEKDKSEPWYFGKIYINAKTLAVVKANYSLNVDNKRKASKLFVAKKPNSVDVYPISVNYQIDYREENGKWYYGYSNAVLEFLINWDKKLFNSRYTLNSEMAITDRELYNNQNLKQNFNMIGPYVVMVDDVSGFSDSNFWGNNNIIEPEKSIQNAIEKIQKHIEK